MGHKLGFANQWMMPCWLHPCHVKSMVMSIITHWKKTQVWKIDSELVGIMEYFQYCEDSFWVQRERTTSWPDYPDNVWNLCMKSALNSWRFPLDCLSLLLFFFTSLQPVLWPVLSFLCFAREVALGLTMPISLRGRPALWRKWMEAVWRQWYRERMKGNLKALMDEPLLSTANLRMLRSTVTRRLIQPCVSKCLKDLSWHQPSDSATP